MEDTEELQIGQENIEVIENMTIDSGIKRNFGEKSCCFQNILHTCQLIPHLNKFKF